MSGTLYLLNSGVQRQEPQDREKWLSLVGSLMGVKLSVINKPERFSGTQVAKLNLADQDKYLLLAEVGKSQALQMEVSSISEQIINATAFLLLNDLGRYPAEQRQQRFEQLSNAFPYEIARINTNRVNFDSEQLERLSRGETIVVWQTELGRSLHFEVYAPWGNSGDLLRLGPIHFFDPFPAWLTILGLTIALIFLAVWVMAIIQKLAQQLKLMQAQVDGIEPEYIDEQTLPTTPDLVGQLKWKIDSMSGRIERLLSQKSYMIRAVSHDLRTPLSKAQFRLENLAIELGADHPMLLATKQNLAQLNLMIDELLSYEKLSQQQDIQFERMELVAITQQLTQDIQIVFPHADFTCVSNARSCLVDINPPLFVRMMENLLNNAGRYCDKKVLVSISVQSSYNYIEISVKDDGEGISEQAKESIFDPFFQVEQSRNNEAAGYGLGLAIVKQIVLQHQATIHLADSNHGAHFVVRLPLKQGRTNDA